MALFDKLNQVAKSIGDKTGDAIETGKQNAKILSERNAASKDLEKIGEFYYQLFAGGGAVAPEVLELCRSAQAHYDAIEAAQNEIAGIKAGTPAPDNAAPGTCPACGAAVEAGSGFCPQCGQRMEG